MITILLVDHANKSERSVRELLTPSSANDFKLDIVRSYREILQGFRRNTYDVCLIDSGFGNGLRLSAQARALGCTAPIILVTENNADEVLEAMHSGVGDCLIRDELDASRIERAICSVVEQARRATLQIERERRYLALLDNAGTIIYTHDLAGNFTSINGAGERLLGYSQQEIVSMHVSQLVEPKYHPLVRNMIERTLDARVEMVEKMEFLTKEESNLGVAVRVYPIYRDGKAVEIQGIITTLHAYPSSGTRGLGSLLQTRFTTDTRSPTLLPA